ncbi:MAG TPA: TonB-dependent receptor [Gemmatimonadaceae bacterium]|nr:TonB-dependent receptor [Gemmatimonadaceae bacterium]
MLRSLFPLLFLIPLCASTQQPNERFVRLRSDGNGIAALQAVVPVAFDSTRVEDAVQQLLTLAQMGIAYDRDLPGLDRRVTLKASRMRVAAALVRVLRETPLELRVSAGGQAVLVRRPDGDRSSRGGIVGRVREEVGEALANARVQIVGTRHMTITDADGRFALRDVDAGVYELSVMRIGYRPAQLIDVSVEADETIELDVPLERAPTPLAAVVVTPGHFGIMGQQVASQASLTRDEIETNPQLGEDIFRAVTRLPGVTSYDFSAAFRVRGGPNDELLVRLDGLELYEPFHLKDYDAALSIVDVAAIGGIDLSTGGFGVEFGNRQTGVFDMRTADPPPGEKTTALALTLTNVRAMTRGSFGARDQGRWLLSARRGYLDYAWDLVNVTDAPDPTYYDVLGKLEYQLSDAHSLSAHVLYASDRLDFVDEPEDPHLTSSYGSSYGWLAWRYEPRSPLRVESILSAGRLTWDRRGDRIATFDNVHDVHVADDRSMTFVGARQDWSWELSDRFMFKWGGEARRFSTSYDYFAWVRDFLVDGDTLITVFDTTLVRAEPNGWAAGVYVAQRVRPIPSLTAELGLRYDRHDYTGDNGLSPRVNVAYAIGSATTLRAAWGRYRQAQGIHQLQVQDGDDIFYPAESAEQRVLGLELSLPRGMLARVEGYQRKIDDTRPRYVNFGNTVAESFPEILDDRRRIAPDEAEARGLELFVKQSGASSIDWSASYALAEAKDRLNGAWVPRSIDQRHTVYLDVAYRPNSKWRLSAAWQYHTGWPYTPFTFHLDTLSDGRIAVTRVFGALNSERLSAYHRLDLRVTRHFPLRRGRLSVFLDLFNAYNRINARALDYFIIHSNGGRSVSVGAQRDELLPRLPSFGVVWEF